MMIPAKTPMMIAAKTVIGYNLMFDVVQERKKKLAYLFVTLVHLCAKHNVSDLIYLHFNPPPRTVL